MALEIERKFLVKGDYKSLAHAKSHIIQGYICSGRGRTVRVRMRDDAAFLTIKGPSRNGGLSRYEFEKEITRDEGLSLLSLCEPGLAEKVRWLVRVGKHVFEWTSSSARTPDWSLPKWNWARKTKTSNARTSSAKRSPETENTITPRSAPSPSRSGSESTKWKSPL